MDIGLGEQSVGFCLEGPHRVSTAGKSGRWLDESRKLHNDVGKLYWIATLFAIHAAPSVGAARRWPIPLR